LLVSVVVALGLAAAAGCKRSRHARVSTFTPPLLQAGYVERTGAGWRIAVPSTWKPTAQKGPAAWSAADPQPVDDFHANVNVFVEPFTGESYDYARANEAALRREPRAVVEIVRDEVVDADPTLVLESHWAPAPASSVAYKTMQSALASRGSGYVVTCSVAASAFERYRSTCDAMVRSFAVER
ncbi:MAG TPA: hypothetical protein VE987_04760, partial [Polyangiaceae bacterium]|nr:hypothetical protein [Polyangiaceae bacterium]